MTDAKLISRLQDAVNGEHDMTPHGADLLQAIDCIENMKAQAEHIAELEGKLENALEALERIGKGEFAGQMLMSLPPQDAGAYFARMTLATIKLKGKCDD